MEQAATLIALIISVFGLIGAAFAAGQMLGKKQDKSVCAESHKELYIVINDLRTQISNLSQAVSILTVKLEALKK
jgi:hypothetical protein